jgi:hypothetical protein
MTTGAFRAYMDALDDIAPKAARGWEAAYRAPGCQDARDYAETMDKIREGLLLRARQTAPSDTAGTTAPDEAQKPLAGHQNAPRRRQGAML